jgi:hypothetical protein
MTQPDDSELPSAAATCAKERDFEQAIVGLKRLTENNPKREIATAMLAAITPSSR